MCRHLGHRGYRFSYYRIDGNKNKSHSYRNKKVSELLQGKSVLLIYKGELQEHNLHKTEITQEEVEAAVREHGVADIDHVDLAILEVDGNISVISNDFKNKTVHPVGAMGHRKKHRLRGRIN